MLFTNTQVIEEFYTKLYLSGIPTAEADCHRVTVTNMGSEDHPEISLEKIRTVWWDVCGGFPLQIE